MNREQRRIAQRQDKPTEDGISAPSDLDVDAVERVRPRPSQPGAPRRRGGPRQFLHEVTVEMRKVAWPTKAETINYSAVVFFTLAIVMAMIFGLDLGFSKLSSFLFK